MLKKDTLNASMIAKDIYYNFQLIKEVIKNNKEIENCIVTIAHYNFHYDMSLVNNQFYRELLSNVYYANLHDKHNCVEDLSKYEFKGNMYTIPLEIRDVFKSELSDLILEESFVLKSVYEEYFNDKYIRTKQSLKAMSSEKQKMFEEAAKAEGERVVAGHNKLIKYKKTEIENKGILKELLLFLNQHNIKATLVVFPKPIKYRELINPEYKNMFDTYLQELKSDYCFNIIDLYEDNRLK